MQTVDQQVAVWAEKGFKIVGVLLHKADAKASSIIWLADVPEAQQQTILKSLAKKKWRTRRV